MTEAERGRKAEETKRKGSVKGRSHSQPNKISGDNSWRVPPVPIPNTEVKPPHADGTWLETARESRSSPDSKREDIERYPLFLSFLEIVISCTDTLYCVRKGLSRGKRILYNKEKMTGAKIP